MLHQAYLSVLIWMSFGCHDAFCNWFFFLFNKEKKFQGIKNLPVPQSEKKEIVLEKQGAPTMVGAQRG